MSFKTFLAFNFMIKSFSKSLLLRIIIIKTKIHRRVFAFYTSVEFGHFTL